MKVLSLFDGISCGRLALERANITVQRYFASEIEPNAIKISQKNYPDIIQLGDICKWETWNIDWGQIDLLIGGSPCQGFSFAGKQLNFNDTRSKLFFIYVDILNHIKKFNPKIKFLLENVNMRKEYKDIISKYLGVQAIEIDSKLLTPMRRKRNYWANWKIKMPLENRQEIKDLLEKNVDEKYFMKSSSFKKNTYIKNNTLFIKNLSNKEIAVNENDCVVMSRAWQVRMPLIRQESHCIRAANPDDIGIAVNTSNGLRFRKFTLHEMEKLQTLPVGYTELEGVSERKSKSCIGNGWTVDVIAHILRSIPKEDR